METLKVIKILLISKYFCLIDRGLAYEDVYIETEDKVKLHGYLLKFQLIYSWIVKTNY